SRLPSTYARATPLPCLDRIFDRWLPCSRLTLAVVFPVAHAPTVRASNTSTSLPARANRTAVISPVIPAPTTITSALRVLSSSLLAAQGCSTRSLSHKDVTLWLIPRQQEGKTPAVFTSPPEFLVSVQSERTQCVWGM